MDLDVLKEQLEEMTERRIFTQEETEALIAMYEITYPVEFQNRGFSVDEIIALKGKHMQLLEEAQQLNPLITSVLSLPAVAAAVDEDADYV